MPPRKRPKKPAPFPPFTTPPVIPDNDDREDCPDPEEHGRLAETKWKYRLEIVKYLGDTTLKIITAIGAVVGPALMLYMQAVTNAKLEEVSSKADQNAVIAEKAVKDSANEAVEKVIEESQK